MKLETTPAMRARIRELAYPAQDEYDRAVLLLCADFDNLLISTQPQNTGCPPHKPVKKSEGDTRYWAECEKCGAHLRDIPIPNNA